jgi:hypothetical protein
MNIENLKAKLADDEFKALSDYIADLTGQRDAARQESIDGRKKLKADVEQLRGIKTKLYEKLGLDDDADLDALPEVKGQAEAVKQVEAKLKRLERELADANKARGDIENRFKTSRRDAELSKAIAAHEFIDNDLVANFASSRVRFEGDDLFFEAEDGKLVSVADGVKHIAATKPHLLKARGAGGSGHLPSAGSGRASTMSAEDFQALNPAQRMEAAKAGVQIA